MWPSVVTEHNRTSNRHVSYFSLIDKFHFIKQLAVVRSVNCTPSVGKINEQYTPAISKKVARTFPAERRVLAFLPRCCFSEFSPLRVCQLRLGDVMMHSRLITGDNVPQEIVPLCIISSLIFLTRQDGLLSDLPSRGYESILPTLFGNPWALPYDIQTL